MSRSVVVGALLLAGAAGCTGPLVYRAPVKEVKPVETVKVGSQVKVPLPPVPDRKKNSATVAGIDTTGMGVRDDVHVWIFTDYSTAAKRGALVTMGKTLQSLMVHPPKTNEEARKLNQSIKEALGGLKAVPGIQPTEVDDMDNRLYLQTVNTPQRLNEYLRYNYLLNEKK